jgi:hypothetical protein
MAFIVIGLIVSQVVARIWFPSQPGEGFNVRQLLTATAIGAVFGGVGWFIGFLVDKMLKSKR